MLRSIEYIYGYAVKATDGEIGDVYDFFFDDEQWKVQYLICDTGNWLSGRKVIISPAAFYNKPDWETKTFPVIFTKKMVKESPEIDTAKPVSRKRELDMIKYYNWPVYWHPHPVTPLDLSKDNIKFSESEEDEEKSYLRSTREVTGYHIQATDDEIGHVDDFIVNDENWVIQYIVVDTRNWLPGRKVLIATTWIDKVSWNELKVYVGLKRELIKTSPEYDPSKPVNREYEEVLYDYYGRPKYWG
jgi:uncharacterized protein YrrD